MKTFTWWRRFHSVVKLPKQALYKGAPELLQRIEFGEFEFNHLGREWYLEDKIFEQQINQLKIDKPWLTEESLEDQTIYIRKLTNKRKNSIMKSHLEIEMSLLQLLKTELAKEFEMDSDEVREIMETFDGTTRELYLHLLSLKQGRTYDPEQIPRLFREQPRHILKPKERKYEKLWMEVIKERDYAKFLNWQ
jgi:hypothetical protein